MKDPLGGGAKIQVFDTTTFFWTFVFQKSSRSLIRSSRASDLEVVGLSSSFHLDAFPPNRAHFPSWDSSRKMESDATAAPWEIFKENAQPIKRGRDTKRLGR